MASELLGVIAPHPPIMVPDVGGVDSRVTARSAKAMAVARRALQAFQPDALVVMSPHAPAVADAFLVDDSATLAGDLGAFGASGTMIAPPGAPALAEAVCEEALALGLAVERRSAHRRLDAGVLDHGVLVPLTFLDAVGCIPIVVLSLSYLPLADHRLLGRAVRAACVRTGTRAAFIASGDCSHRLTPGAPAGYSPCAERFDAELVELLSAGDYGALESIDPDLIEDAGECGLRSFITLGGFLEGSDTHTRVLSYESPWGVGYLTALAASPDLLASLALSDEALSAAAPSATESEVVALARRSIEEFIGHHRVTPAGPAEGVLASRHGAFVSLHRNGDLRGCIGTIAPTRATLADEIVHNAIQAATGDPRFPPLAPEELADLEISVDVLGTPEPAVADELDPRVYGVIVESDWRRGLLLPDLEGVDTVEDQLAIACRKAGIAPGEPYRIERFTVTRYH